MAKQIRGFWKRLCAIFATILGVGAVHKDANAVADWVIPASEIKSMTNCEYIVDRCEDGVHVGTLEGGYGCQYHTYQATGETARLLASYAGKVITRSVGDTLGCAETRFPGSLDNSVVNNDPTSATIGGVPVFCYDLWVVQNLHYLIQKHNTNLRTAYNGSLDCDSSTVASDGGLEYNECSSTALNVGLARTSDTFDYDGATLTGRLRQVVAYSNCTLALARLVGCADTSHVYARNGVPKYASFNGTYPVLLLEDVENGTHSCIDLGCGNFAGDTDLQNNYSMNQNACYVNVADYVDVYGSGDYYDESGTFEYVAYDADENQCNCFSNGNVVCS